MLFLTVVSLLACASARITSVEHADGSFSVGNNVQTRGSTGDSAYALLTKGQGWTDATNNYKKEDEIRARQSIQSTTLVETPNIPYLEVLKLVEAFLKVKGEIGSRINALFIDNSELFRAVWTTIIKKIAGLHRFTLAGLVVLRKVLQFAASLFSQWSVNVDVNQGFFG